MAKVETYRGKALEELKKIGVREFAKYVNSRERRTLLRQSNIIERFVKKCKECQEKKKPIKTHLRDIIIVPEMVGLSIQVHNGKTFIPVLILFEMIGHRLGEFAITTQKVQHGAPGIGATKSSAAQSVK